ncbi:UNKNOWN [Stylonychia lemnae]|uniref:Uncharacterized protein n=1 Tax=Stylonychia lemnae TaxID=5949 RepID=A0A078AFS7_STYLE|nr:UNKNOWN [Stylonychia lemnae]|eukprot:CDW80347.1 UNKNOWN [Stylonychia lemnae]
MAKLQHQKTFDSFLIAKNVLYETIIAKVEKHFYEKYLETKKESYATIKTILESIKTVEFANLPKDDGEVTYKNKNIAHEWQAEFEPREPGLDTSAMEELKVKQGFRIADTTFEGQNINANFSFGAGYEQKRTMTIRTSYLRDQKKSTKIIKSAIADYAKHLIPIEKKRNEEDDEIELKVGKLRQQIEIDEKQRQELIQKKKNLKDQLRGGNINGLSSNLNASPSKTLGDDQGLFNLLQKDKQSVTFDYNGNLILVKNPKLQNRMKFETSFQIQQEASSINQVSRGKISESHDESNDGDLDPDQGMFNKKAYYGQIIQALYSQPHKMIDLKPGVLLNEGGKQYGGQIPYSKENRIDLETYKKSRERTSGNPSDKTAVNRIKVGSNNNNMPQQDSQSQRQHLQNELMKSNGMQSTSLAYQSDMNGMMNSFQNNTSINNQQISAFLNNSSTMINRDTRSHLTQKKNKSQFMKHRTPNRLNKIKLNSTFIREEALHQSKLNASVFEEYNDVNKNNISTFSQEASINHQMSTKNVIQNILQSAKEESSAHTTLSANPQNQSVLVSQSQSFLPDSRSILSSIASKNIKLTKLDNSMVKLPHISSQQMSSQMLNQSNQQLQAMQQHQQQNSQMMQTAFSQRNMMNIKSTIKIFRNEEERQNEMNNIQNFQEMHSINKSRAGKKSQYTISKHSQSKYEF